MCAFIQIENIGAAEMRLMKESKRCDEAAIVEGPEKALEDLRKEMQAFTYSISHDFQAPVRRIIGLGQIIKEDHSPELGEAGIKYLDMILSEAGRMNEMIADLLTYSRTSSREIRSEDIDLSRTMQGIVRDLEMKEGTPSVQIEIEKGMHVRGDEAMLDMALRELIDNAIKFGKKGSIPHIVFARDRQRPGVFFIKDDGVGFDPSRSDRLFRPFQRLHGSEYPGQGMGLTIAAMVIKKHGGRIWAESQVGKGATFYFTIGSID